MLDEANEALFARARSCGQKALLGSIITRRSSYLHSLEEIKDTCAVRAHHGASKRNVPIRQIRGSESRSSDFDSDFNPLHDRNKGRWLSVAGACQRNKRLPPVALIQIGDIYFVRDGHHRISVARALGQTAIEATVEVWQVEGPLPWDESMRGHGHGSITESQEGACVADRLQQICTRLQTRVHDFLSIYGTALGRLLPRSGPERL